MNYNSQITMRQTKQFRKWLKNLKNHKAKALIAARLHRLQETGVFGDTKRFDGIGEMRFHQSPGYRVYFTEQDSVVVILLCGGNKGTQARDIERAKKLAREISDHGNS